MTEEQKATVDTPCRAYQEMSENWTLIDDLLAGSQAMRERSSEYLPMHDKEETKYYNARVARSTLFSAYADTVKTIVSKPFSKPLTVQGDLPEPLADIAKDVDGQGTTLMQLARELFGLFVNRGLAHILVDYPVTASEDGETPNLSQERNAGYRPRFIPIAPDDLIAWRTEPDAAGRPVLTQIRIAETQTEPDGEWGEKLVNYVRVIEPDRWSVWMKGDDEYIQFNNGVNSLGKIPLVTGYANKSGYLTADPPLKELAETNRGHYQSASDQSNILHMARTVTLTIQGFTEDEADKVALGPNQVISTTNANSKVGFTEHTGKAIEAGQVDLDKREEQMMVMGLQPFMRRVSNQTATGQGIDEDRANCDIQAWVMALEQLVHDAYVVAGEWVSAEVPEDFKANVFNDFAIWMRAAKDVDSLLKIRQAGELSRRTYLQEVKRRSILSDTVDIEEEVAAIEAEGPALGAIGREEE